jgi:hypothetical protein
LDFLPIRGPSGPKTAREIDSWLPAPALQSDYNRSVHQDGIRQGGYGDCFFEAALASMSQTTRGAEQISKIVETNPDGSYTVTFPGRKESPIAVSQSELRAYKVNNLDQLANVVEVAFLKLDNVKVQQTGNDAINNFAPYRADKEALELLTGKAVSSDQTDFLSSSEIGLGATSKENIESDIREALERGAPVTASTRPIPEEAQGPYRSVYYASGDKYPLPGAHTFSVIAYDPKDETVTLRNPWRNMHDTPLEATGSTNSGITHLGLGKIKMPMDTFMKYYREVNFAGKSQFESSRQHVANDLGTMAKELGSTKPSSGLSHLSSGIQEGFFLVSEPIFHGMKDFAHDMTNVMNMPSGENAGKASVDLALIFGTSQLLLKSGARFNTALLGTLALSYLAINLIHHPPQAAAQK